MSGKTNKYSIQLTSVEHQNFINGVEDLLLHTNEGTVVSRFHKSMEGNSAIVWVGGANGGLDGPAQGLFARLALMLIKENISSLRLHYRFPNNITECILDTLLGVEYLSSHNKSKVVLVGHSFGGAVVINAAALNEKVVAVAALSSQTYGTNLVDKLSPRPLLLIHGKEDEILPESCSLDIYSRAHEPKTIILYPDCKHGLDESMGKVDEDLNNWIIKVLNENYR